MGTYIGFSNSVGATLGALVNQNELPENYWQENDTENYFIENVTNEILTLEEE